MNVVSNLEKVHFWTHGGIRKRVTAESPLVMGHEASGVVHSIGSAATSLKPGDRIAIEPGYPCRRCKMCKDGRYNLCPDMRFAASPPKSHGALAKFYRLPEDFCYKISPSIGLDEAVLVEPLAVAVHIVRLADIRPGQSVVVFGAGTIGLLSAAVAKSFGAKTIIAVDIKQERLDFARGFAATATFTPDGQRAPEENASALLDENNLNPGADVVVEASGAESSIEAGIHVLRPGGSYVQGGFGKPRISFPIALMSEKELTMRGCFRYSSGDFELALDLLETKQVVVKGLISSIVPFEQATEAWERTRRGEGIKNLIRGVQD